MRRESSKVLALELGDDVDVEAGLLGEGEGLAVVVASMTKFLTHEAIVVTSIERLFSQAPICHLGTCPSAFWPHHLCNCCVYVSRFTSIKVSTVTESVPFDCPDAEGLSGLGVRLSKLPPRISNEYGTERLFNILEISACSELGE